MSAGLPRGAPLSAHEAISAISASLNEGSFLNFWMPMFLSTKKGGMAPLWLLRAVRAFMERAQGLASSYVRSDMGATESGRWQSWQLRWRMGAMSFVKVTSPVVGAGACAVVPTVAVTSEASSRPTSPKIPGRRCLDITTPLHPSARFKISVILPVGRLNTQLQAKERKSGPFSVKREYRDCG